MLDSSYYLETSPSPSPPTDTGYTPPTYRSPNNVTIHSHSYHVPPTLPNVPNVYANSVDFDPHAMRWHSEFNSNQSLHPNNHHNHYYHQTHNISLDRKLDISSGASPPMSRQLASASPSPSTTTPPPLATPSYFFNSNFTPSYSTDFFNGGEYITSPHSYSPNASIQLGYSPPQLSQQQQPLQVLRPSTVPNMNPTSLPPTGGAQFTVIANVPYDTVRQDLVLEFRKFGRVELAMVVCDESSRHPHKEWTSTAGYAFVRFQKRSEAAAAIDAATQGLITIRGAVVRADWARKDSYAKRSRSSTVVPQPRSEQSTGCYDVTTSGTASSRLLSPADRRGLPNRYDGSPPVGTNTHGIYGCGTDDMINEVSRRGSYYYPINNYRPCDPMDVSVRADFGQWGASNRENLRYKSAPVSPVSSPRDLILGPNDLKNARLGEPRMSDAAVKWAAVSDTDGWTGKFQESESMELVSLINQAVCDALTLSRPSRQTALEPSDLSESTIRTGRSITTQPSKRTDHPLPPSRLHASTPDSSPPQEFQMVDLPTTDLTGVETSDLLTVQPSLPILARRFATGTPSVSSNEVPVESSNRHSCVPPRCPATPETSCGDSGGILQREETLRIAGEDSGESTVPVVAGKHNVSEGDPTGSTNPTATMDPLSPTDLISLLSPCSRQLLVTALSDAASKPELINPNDSITTGSEHANHILTAETLGASYPALAPLPLSFTPTLRLSQDDGKQDVDAIKSNNSHCVDLNTSFESPATLLHRAVSSFNDEIPPRGAPHFGSNGGSRTLAAHCVPVTAVAMYSRGIVHTDELIFPRSNVPGNDEPDVTVSTMDEYRVGRCLRGETQVGSRDESI